jgi:hypothetical protein
MRTRIPMSIAIAAAWLAIGCGGSQSPNNDGGDAAGPGGGDGGGPAMDGAADQASCVAVCGMVTGVLAAHPGDCTFPLPCSPPLAFTALVVFVDGQQVPQEGTEGWSYAGTSRAAIQLHGQACAAVQSNNALVDVVHLCELP